MPLVNNALLRTRKELSVFAADERGATAIEYGLIIALISMAMTFAMMQLSTNLKTLLYDQIATIFN